MFSLIKIAPFLLSQFWKIRRFEKWSPERNQQYQIKQFRIIFEKAKKIPFYRNLYKEAGVMDLKINTLEDIAKIPTINKALCREEGYENDFPTEVEKGTLLTPTSGSTGIPFQVRIPSRIEMVPPVKVIHAMIQFGWKPWDKGLEIWREDASTHKGIMRKLGLLKSISIFKPLAEIKDKIDSEKPNFLFCNRTFYTVLAEYLEKVKYKYSPKFLLCTAEEVNKDHRKRLEEFYNTKLINVYGVMESPTIAYSCPECDNLHVFQTTVLVEVVNKRLIDGVEYGDVVITNLLNDYMPFIRYRTGDVIKVVDPKCICGRNSQVIGDILGRSDDVITLKDGRAINYLHLYQSFRGLKFLNQYKVLFYQSEEKLEFCFRLNDLYNIEESKKQIQNTMNEFFSDYDYSIKYVDKFEFSKSGKFKTVELIK